MLHPKPVDHLRHYRYIDALRGIAFLGVLLVHCGESIRDTAVNESVRGGRYGVQLFFLLSAITLFRSLSVRATEERHPVRNYFIRRFFRIAPLFWFGIVLYGWLEGNGPSFRAPDGRHVWQYAATTLFLHGWAPTSINSVVPGGWSIAVEMTFYLCLPWLFRHVRGLWTALTATFVSLVLGVVASVLAAACLEYVMPENRQPLIGEFVSLWFPAQLCVFLLGAATFYALEDPRVRGVLTVHPSRPLVLIAAGAYGLFALEGAFSFGWIPLYFLYAACFVPLIVGLSVRPLPLFVNGLTRALGTISFSCYLTHFAALRVLNAALATDWYRATPLTAAWTPFGVTLLGTLALTVVFSTATYWLIERPGMALGRALIRRGEPSLDGRGAMP